MRVNSSINLICNVIKSFNLTQFFKKGLTAPHNIWKMFISRSAVHNRNNRKCYTWLSTYVTGFGKRGLIHASDFATLMSHNFVCD